MTCFILVKNSKLCYALVIADWSRNKNRTNYPSQNLEAICFDFVSREMGCSSDATRFDEINWRCFVFSNVNSHQFLLLSSTDIMQHLLSTATFSWKKREILCSNASLFEGIIVPGTTRLQLYFYVTHIKFILQSFTKYHNNNKFPFFILLFVFLLKTTKYISLAHWRWQ